MMKKNATNVSQIPSTLYLSWKNAWNTESEVSTRSRKFNGFSFIRLEPHFFGTTFFFHYSILKLATLPPTWWWCCLPLQSSMICIVTAFSRDLVITYCTTLSASNEDTTIDTPSQCRKYVSTVVAIASQEQEESGTYSHFHEEEKEQVWKKPWWKRHQVESLGCIPWFSSSCRHPTMTEEVEFGGNADIFSTNMGSRLFATDLQPSRSFDSDFAEQNIQDFARFLNLRCSGKAWVPSASVIRIAFREPFTMLTSQHWCIPKGKATFGDRSNHMVMMYLSSGAALFGVITWLWKTFLN